MSEIQVIDKFLEDNEFEKVQSLLMGESFPWFWQDGVNHTGPETDGYFQFAHHFYYDSIVQSNYFNSLRALIQKLNIFSIFRIKANLLTATPDIVTHGMHVDFPVDYLKTAIFYVNTNNGYTVFSDQEKVDSVENRMVIFPCSLEHSGTSCTDQQKRVVINFNYAEGVE